MVLGRDGGMIKQMWLPFFMGLGGPIGSGTQYLPWIHIDDLTNLITFAIETPQVEGILNGVAPEVNRFFINSVKLNLIIFLFIKFPLSVALHFSHLLLKK